MTAVGKILVFFNLLFSLAVGGLTVASYISRTYWVDGYHKLQERYQVAASSTAALRSENDQLVRERQELNDKLTRLAGKQAGIKGTEDVDRAAGLVAKALEDALGRVNALQQRIDRVLELRALEAKPVMRHGQVARAHPQVLGVKAARTLHGKVLRGEIEWPDMALRIGERAVPIS